MEVIREILNYQILGISVIFAVKALAFIFGGFLLRWISTIVLNKLRNRATQNGKIAHEAFLNALLRPLGWTTVLLGIWAAVKAMPLPVLSFDLERFFISIIKASFVATGTWFLVNLVNRYADVLLIRAEKTETRLDNQIIPVARNSIRVFLVLLACASVLQELGYSVGSLLTGLGIGGAAIALASKDTLANLFGSVVIFIDRPFHVGDWVQIDDLEGTVEEVGLRVTRIRTFANSLITLPNAMLTTKTINNWSKMRKRRIKLSLGLTYATTPEEMNTAVKTIRQVLRNDPAIDQEFFLVNFTDFGASSLDILIYCFTTTTDWAAHLEARQQLLLKIMQELRELNLEIAFPTQTVIFENSSDNSDINAMPGDLPD